MYIYNDAGRSKSKRAKQSNDCTVRAFALALRMRYDDAYDTLAAAGRRSGRGFNLHLMTQHLNWIPLPAQKGVPRLKLEDFPVQYPQGRYIVRVSKHVTTVIDGELFDTFEPRPTKVVYGYWTPKPIEKQQHINCKAYDCVHRYIEHIGITHRVLVPGVPNAYDEAIAYRNEGTVRLVRSDTWRETSRVVSEDRDVMLVPI